MTAGRGIIHSEMPKVTSGDLWGFQLWLNLPAKDKMVKPRCAILSTDCCFYPDLYCSVPKTCAVQSLMYPCLVVTGDDSVGQP